MSSIEIFQMAVSDPKILQLQSPVFGAGLASWVIPAVLWLAIFYAGLKYFEKTLSILKSETFQWAWLRFCAFTKATASFLRKEPEYPSHQPIRNLVAEFLKALIYHLFAFWFMAYGATLVWLGVTSMNANFWGGMAIGVLGIASIGIGRIYLDLATKSRRMLVQLWAQSMRRSHALAVVFSVTTALIAVGNYLANQPTLA